MRVLHVALNAPGSSQHCLREALQSCSSAYMEVDWIKEEIAGRNVSKVVLDASLQFQPDITFMQLQRGDVVRPADAAQMVGKVYNWTGDVRYPLSQWYKDLGAVVTCSFFTNMEDVMEMRRCGLTADYLQIGFNPDIYKRDSSYLTSTINYIGPIDIVFMGHNYGETFPLSNLRRELSIRLFDKFSGRFGVFGSGWPPYMRAVDCYGRPLFEAAIYNRAKIAINMSHFEYTRYSSDRLFRIIGSGCCCISHYFPGIEEYAGKLAWFSGATNAEKIDSCIELVSDLLRFSDVRNMIADSGYQYAHSQCTWKKRLERLFQ